jgi:hypothetical protein
MGFIGDDDLAAALAGRQPSTPQHQGNNSCMFLLSFYKPT